MRTSGSRRSVRVRWPSASVKYIDKYVYIYTFFFD